MDLGFEAAAAVISGQLSPQCPPQVLCGSNCGVPRSGPGCVVLPQLRILARRYDCVGISRGNRIVVFACVVCPVNCNATEFLISGDQTEQVRQHGRVPDTAAGDLDSPYFQRLFINPNMYLAPQPSFGSTVLAYVPFSLAFSFDTRAVYQQMQQPG